MHDLALAEHFPHIINAISVPLIAWPNPPGNPSTGRLDSEKFDSADNTIVRIDWRGGDVAMGWVWTIMLSFSSNELWDEEDDRELDNCEPLEQINAFLDPARLVSLTESTWGPNAGQGMEANLYGGGFKHFDIEGFIETVMAQKWKDRARVQLWVKGDEDESFRLIKLGRRRATPP